MIEKRRVLRHALWASAIVCAVAMAASAVSAYVTEGAPAGAAVLSTTPAAPGAQVWTFDHDRGYHLPKDWTAVSGQWEVLTDYNAPSLPNTLGLGGFGLPHTRYLGLWFKSFFTNHYLIALPKDAKDYANLTLQANFLPWGGAWGSYAGLVFRYLDPKNYYVLVAACPKEYVGLYRMSAGQLTQIKRVSVPEIKRGQWYSIKVVALGNHFTGFFNGKKMFEAQDSRLVNGRIGLWSQNDSRVNFDNVQVIPGPPAPRAASNVPVKPLKAVNG